MEISWTITVLAAVFVGLLQEGRTKSHKKKDVVKSQPLYAEEETTTTEDPLQQILPLVTFECTNRTGYYADVQFNCEVFHYCKADGSRFTFLCPQTSRFNQKYMICDYDSVDVDLCGRAKRYYSLNDQIYPNDDADVFIRTSALKNPIKKTSTYKYPPPEKRTRAQDIQRHQNTRFVSQLSETRITSVNPGEALRGSSTTSKQRQQPQSQPPSFEGSKVFRNHHNDPVAPKKRTPPNQQSVPQIARPHQMNDPGTSYAYFQLSSSENHESVPSSKSQPTQSVIRHPSPTSIPDVHASLAPKTDAPQDYPKTKNRQETLLNYQRPNRYDKPDGSGISSHNGPQTQAVSRTYFELHSQENSGGKKGENVKQETPPTLGYDPKSWQSDLHRDFAQSSPPTIRTRPGEGLAFGRDDSLAQKSTLKNNDEPNRHIYPEGSLYTWDEEKKLWVPVSPEHDKKQYGLRTSHSNKPSSHSPSIPLGYGDDISSLLQQQGKTQVGWAIDSQNNPKEDERNIFTNVPIFPLPRAPELPPATSHTGRHQADLPWEQPLKPPTPRKRYTLKKDPIAQLYEAEFKKLKKKDETKTIKLSGEETHSFGFSTPRVEFTAEESAIISSFPSPALDEKYGFINRQVPLESLPSQTSHSQVSLPIEALLDRERSLPLEGHGHSSSPIVSASSDHQTYSGIFIPHLELLLHDGYQGEAHKRRRKRQVNSPQFFNQPFGNQLLNSFSSGGSFNPFTGNPFRNSFFPEFGSSSNFGNTPFLDGSLGTPGLNLNSFRFPESFNRQLANRETLSNTRGRDNNRGTNSRDVDENNDRVKIKIDITDRPRRLPDAQGPRSELSGPILPGRPASNGPTRRRPEGPHALPQGPILPLRQPPPSLQQPIEALRSIIQNPPEPPQSIRRLPNPQFRGPQSFRESNQRPQNGPQFRPNLDIHPLGPPSSRGRPFTGELRLALPPGVERNRPFGGEARPSSSAEDDRRFYDHQNIVGPRYTIINHPITPPPQRFVPPTPSTEKPNIYIRPERRPPPTSQIRQNPPSAVQRPFQDINNYPPSVYSPEDPLRIAISLDPSSPNGNRGNQHLTVRNNRVSQTSRDSTKPTRATPPPRSRPSVSYQEPQLPPATPAPPPPSYDPFPTRSQGGLFITEPPNLVGQFPNYYRFTGEGQQNEFNLPQIPNLGPFPTQSPGGYYITEPPNLLQGYTPGQDAAADDAKKEREQTRTEPPALFVRPVDVEEPSNQRKPAERTRTSGGRYTAPTPGRKRRPRPQKVNSISSRPPPEVTEASIPATEPPEQHVLSPPLDQSPFTPPALYGPPNPPSLDAFHRDVGSHGGRESYVTERPLSRHNILPPSPPSPPAPPSFDLSGFGRDQQVTSLYQPQTQSPAYYYETTTTTTPAPPRDDGRKRQRQGSEYRRKQEQPVAKVQEDDTSVIGFHEVPFGTRISGSRNRNSIRAKTTTTNRPRRVETTPSSDSRVTGYRQQRRTTQTVVYLDRTPVLQTTTPKPTTTRRPHRRRPQQATPIKRPSSERYSSSSSSDLSGSQSYHSSQPVQSERHHSPLEVSINNNNAHDTTKDISGTSRYKPPIETAGVETLAVPDPSELANHRLTPLSPNTEELSDTESVGGVKISPDNSPSVSVISNSNVNKSPSSYNLPLRPPRPRIRQRPKEETSSRVIYNPPPTYTPPLQNEDRKRVVVSRVSTPQGGEPQDSKSPTEGESANKDGSGSLFGRRPRPTLPSRVRKVTTRKPAVREEATAFNDLSGFSTLTPIVQTSISIVRSVPKLVEDAYQHAASITTATPEDSDREIKLPSPQRVFSSKNGGSYQNSPQRARARLRQRKSRLNSAVRNDHDHLNSAESSQDVVTAKDDSAETTATTMLTTDSPTTVSDIAGSSIIGKSKVTSVEVKSGA